MSFRYLHFHVTHLFSFFLLLRSTEEEKMILKYSHLITRITGEKLRFLTQSDNLYLIVCIYQKRNIHVNILPNLLSNKSKHQYIRSSRTTKTFFYKSSPCFCFHCSYAFVNTSNSCFPNIAKMTVFKFSVFDNSRVTVDIAMGAASFNG